MNYATDDDEHFQNDDDAEEAQYGVECQDGVEDDVEDDVEFEQLSDTKSLEQENEHAYHSVLGFAFPTTKNVIPKDGSIDFHDDIAAV